MSAFSCVLLYDALMFFQNFLGFDFANLFTRNPSLILYFCFAFFLIRLNRVRARVNVLRDSSVCDFLKLFLADLKSRCAEIQSSLNQSFVCFLIVCSVVSALNGSTKYFESIIMQYSGSLLYNIINGFISHIICHLMYKLAIL